LAVQAVGALTGVKGYGRIVKPPRRQAETFKGLRRLCMV
jgi:hypothetical protein